MSDAKKIDLIQVKNQLTRLDAIKVQISSLAKEQEELLEYFKGLGPVLKELQDGLSSVMSELSIPKDSPIQALGLPNRVVNCLISEDIRTIEQLVQHTANQIHKIPNLGKNSLSILQETLMRHGLKLKTPSHS